MSDYTGPPSDAYDSDGSDFEDDNDSDYDVPVAKDKGKEKVNDVEHRSLSAVCLQQTLDDDIRRVASVTGLEHPIVSILLQHFRWNEDRLFQRFMDSPSSALQEAGEPKDELTISRPAKRVKLTPELFSCGICCDEPDPSEVSKLRCGHSFCSNCWQTYIRSKVIEDGQVLFGCMEDSCRTAVDESFLAKHADTACQDRYKELLRRDYVAANPNLRYCPYPSCTETVFCTGGRASSLVVEVPTVTCGNGHSFCFGCGMDSDHRPCICKYVNLWLKGAREDSGTAQWMKANTRECPKCHHNIEKAGGCNRIVCRFCRFQFCWLCLKDWDVHGYNGNENCTAWKELEPDDDATAAQQLLKKFLFYFDRFNNHELSAKLDQQLCEQTEERMLRVQETGQLSWIESKFMKQAVDELTKCRVSLKWSYAMAYYLAPGNHKEIFEDLQANLEAAVEELSQMLEEEIEEDTVKSLRQRMMDKTIYVHLRHDILLRDTAAGLLEGRWEWVDKSQ
ncbi:unnamed protein product [Somion occarium]|uniref:RBR-type E3 ubiquitin transferase n=1 Tax=Somion occarium TaxID=3059160 RepID=A0ABP1D627_9APHY